MNSHQRLAHNRISVPFSLEAAREATWQTFASNQIKSPVIDIEKNIVAGSTPSGMFMTGQNVTASFYPRADGIEITIQSESQQKGALDFGRSKRHAQKLTDALEQLVVQGWSVSNTPPSAETPLIAAPIASPDEAIRPPSSAPIYASAGPWPQGRAVLIYGIVGVLCCQLAAPVAVFHGVKALRDYGPADPGDKSLVIIGLIFGVLGSLLFAFWMFSLMLGWMWG